MLIDTCGKKLPGDSDIGRSRVAGFAGMAGVGVEVATQTAMLYFSRSLLPKPLGLLLAPLLLCHKTLKLLQTSLGGGEPVKCSDTTTGKVQDILHKQFHKQA